MFGFQCVFKGHNVVAGIGNNRIKAGENWKENVKVDGTFLIENEKFKSCAAKRGKFTFGIFIQIAFVGIFKRIRVSVSQAATETAG